MPRKNAQKKITPVQIDNASEPEQDLWLRFPDHERPLDGEVSFRDSELNDLSVRVQFNRVFRDGYVPIPRNVTVKGYSVRVSRTSPEALSKFFGELNEYSRKYNFEIRLSDN